MAGLRSVGAGNARRSTDGCAWSSCLDFAILRAAREANGPGVESVTRLPVDEGCKSRSRVGGAERDLTKRTGPARVRFRVASTPPALSMVHNVDSGNEPGRDRPAGRLAVVAFPLA